MNPMKKIFCCLLFLLSGLLLTAQTIENPTFKARNGSIRNITRIERTPECTKVYIHAIFRPHWWIMEDGDSYLEDAATGKRYAQTGAEGIQLKEKIVMPDSGTTDFVLLFEPLPADVQTVHLIAPNSSESNTYDISLVPAPKDKQPLKSVEGNWFADDAQGRWAYVRLPCHREQPPVRPEGMPQERQTTDTGCTKPRRRFFRNAAADTPQGRFLPHCP